MSDPRDFETLDQSDVSVASSSAALRVTLDSIRYSCDVLCVHFELLKGSEVDCWTFKTADYINYFQNILKPPTPRASGAFKAGKLINSGFFKEDSFDFFKED